jgi:protein-S-isoprenylcysteine O-methyltransferase Ste14
MSLLARNLLFTLVVPGAGAVYVPWWILTHDQTAPTPVAWQASVVIAVGVVLYFSCLWVFVTVGHGTPGPWDAPRRFMAAGPYRSVRNPMYISALFVVLGEAWLFLSLPLLLYGGALAAFFHLFVIGYEEPTLRRTFGETYEPYCRTVPRWIPWSRRRGGRQDERG